MVSFDFTLHLRVRNVGNDVNRIGIRGSVQRQIQNSNGFVEISQTETVYHENNVNFKHRCLLPYRFGGQEDTYMITIYGVRDESGVFTGPLGKVVFQIASIISAGGNRSFPLFPNCFLDIYVSLSETYSQGIRLAFSGHSLHSPDGRPIASYMALILCTPERNILLYKSPVRKGEKHPVWPEFVLPLHLLQYYPNAPLQLHCFNYNVNAADSLIGYFSTTLTQLQVGPGTMNIYMLTDQHGARLSEKTNIVLTKMEPQPVSNILQLFQNNMNIGLGTAIDLTASNGKPDDPSSLHFVHPYSTSAYEHAMLRVLSHIAPLMSQPKIIALGFGAKVEPSYDLSHCFSLSRSNENAFVSGIAGLIEAYRSARIVVKPYAPTDFSEVIYYISKFAKAEAKNPHGLYFILIILTDGGPAQPTKTINAIVDSSPYPMSIIAVGVGSSRDFTSLKALESPYLKHTDGRQLARQNFRFVEAGRIDTDDAIALVPMDITSWAANKA